MALKGVRKMIIILTSASPKHNNDSIVPGLTHYMVSASLGKEPFLFARYIIDEKCLELLDRKYNVVSQFTPAKTDGHSQLSTRYECISQLLDVMKEDDQLKAVCLSDLGKTASEAVKMYFSFLKKGIQLSFYDASYLDTKLHHLNRIPSNDQTVMITNMIEDYFSKSEYRPKLSKEENRLLSKMGDSEKK